jgi:hypothetical protein
MVMHALRVYAGPDIASSSYLMGVMKCETERTELKIRKELRVKADPARRMS